MSRSNNRNTQSVSLFPFLAVLMCAMGSLLTLLIVSTERIRSDAANQPQAVDAAIQSPKPEVPSPPVTPPTESPEPQPLAVTQPPRLVEIPPLVVEVPTVRPTPKLIDPNKPVKESINRLRSETEAARREQSARREHAEQARRSLALAQADLQRITAQLKDQEKKTEQGGKTKRLLDETRLINEQRSHEIRQRIARIRKQSQAGSSKYAFVPYDGDSGTTRRPILIECSESGIRFLPENVIISAEDVHGFTNARNPLLAGAESLLKYWTLRKQTAHNPDEDPEPYILLIVRPSGSVAFYVARRMLSRLKTPFGYELVEDDWQLDLPEPDPQAVEICRTAVEDMLHTRRESDQPVAKNDNINNRGFRFRPGAGGGFIREDDEPESATDKKQSGGSGPAKPNHGGPIEVLVPSNVAGGSNGNGNESATDPYAALDPEAGSVSSPSANGSAATPDNKNRMSDGDGEGHGENGNNSNHNNNSRGIDGHSGPVLSPSQGGRARDLRSGSPKPYFGNAAASERNGSGVRNGLVQEFDSRSGQADAKSRSRSTADKEELPYATLDDEGEVKQPPDAATDEQSPATGGRYGKTQELPSSRWQDSSADKLHRENDRRLTIDGRLQDGPPGMDEDSGLRSRSSARIGQFGPGVPGKAIPLPGNRSRFDADHPRSRRWGLWSPHAAIGFERNIQIEVDADRIVIGKNVITIRPGEASKELLTDVLQAIDDHSRGWGQPPKDFYWVPTIGFIVTPEGSKHVEGLRGPLERWGISSTVLYAPKSPPRENGKMPDDVSARKRSQTIVPAAATMGDEAGSDGVLSARRYAGVIRQPKPLRSDESKAAAQNGNQTTKAVSTGETKP